LTKTNLSMVLAKMRKYFSIQAVWVVLSGFKWF
jgi:hypothetical protein